MIGVLRTVGAWDRLLAVFILATLPASSMAASTAIQWRTDYKQAMQEAKDTGKILLINIHATWCMPCKSLQATTLTDPNLAKYIEERCVPLSVDADESPNIIEQWGVKAYPTQLFVAPDGKLAGKIEGYVNSSKYMAILKQTVQTSGVGNKAMLANRGAGAPPAATRTPAAPPVQASSADYVTRPAAADYANRPSAPPPAAPYNSAAQANRPAAPAVPERVASQMYDNQVRPCDATMPLALEGYCPVSMITQGELIPGYETQCSVYKGQRYQFRSTRERELFYQNPEKYLPGEGGRCVVSWVERNQSRAGQVKLPALFGDHVYFFSDEPSRRKFLLDPERYVDGNGRAYRTAYQSTPGSMVR